MALFVTTLTSGDDTLVFTGQDLFDIPWTINALGGNDSVTINGAKITTGGGDFTICNLDDGDDYARVNGGFVVRVFGGNGNDRVDLYSKAFFDGGPGDDTLNVFAGSSVSMDGGPGADTVNFNADISASIMGGDDDDVFMGNGHAISGSISGGNGNDIFVGFTAPSAGALTLTGGAGNDSFVGTTGGFNGIIIADFSPGDVLRFTNIPADAFQFSLSGNTLTYTGGSLTFGAPLAGTLTLHNLGGRTILTLAPGPVSQVPQNDFNGDGRSDILWRDADGTIFNFLGTANGGFVNNGGNSAVTVGGSTDVAGTGDFNGDGRVDILLRDASGSIFNFLATANGGYSNNGDNSFVTIPTSTVVSGIGDFNGDGRADILWRDSGGTIFNFLGTANGGYTNNGGNSSVTVATSTQVAGVGDFNGDGVSDILFRDASGNIFDFLGTLNGGYSNNGDNSFVSIAAGTVVAGIGDFNGDGRDDILLRDASGNIFDFLGTANGGFINNGGNSAVNVGTSLQIANVGDFNGDGRDDILWRDTSGNIFDFLGAANGGFINNGDNSFVAVATTTQVQDPFL